MYVPLLTAPGGMVIMTLPSGVVMVPPVSGGIVAPLDLAGFVVTIMWNAAAVVFPCVSCAVQVTELMPSGKTLPDIGEHATETAPSTTSFAVTKKETGTLDPSGDWAMISPGTWMTGGVVSFTVTTRVSVLVNPSLSITVSVMVCMPSGKNTAGVAPDADPKSPIQLKIDIVPSGSLEAVPLRLTDAPAEDVASTV
jgi:hypothetical protein